MATIKEIAQKLGVSTTTVSNVIHGKTSEVSVQTLEIVKKGLEKYKYIPNATAVNLAKSRSGIIGFTLRCRHDYLERALSDPFNSGFLNGIYKKAKDKGYQVMIFAADSDEEFLNQILTWNCDGVIILGTPEEEGQIISNRYDGPVVFVDAFFDPEKDNQVSLRIDDVESSYEMTRHIIEYGHRKIAFLCDSERGVDMKRYEGYRKALKESGIEDSPSNRLFVTDGFGGTSQQWDRIVEQVRAYTAVECTSDYFAVQLIKNLIQKGIRVPEDISVTGFDDNDFARFCNPGITTIHQDIREKGELAAHMLIDIIKGGRSAIHQTVLKTWIVDRESLRPID
ncbi:LacI family DNA-binding transcriptional regulator [Butyrivibrio sp. MC2013]|uniref:LacI family DNA-binding transcriptional regulator n=1 Tax=Butyrivibrio sp. MC2013 TaxID=1280686 RepID=UPI0004153E7A|nr:LacI family DNA-binding transcriptional regulator [Butyrivibrio sp. MC2013]